MRIMTVRNPWAGAIIWRGKDVENRGRNLAGDWRGTIAIHVSLRHDYEAVPAHNLIAGHLDEHSVYGYGCIIGVVDLVDVHHDRQCHDTEDSSVAWAPCSPWADADTYHLVLANPRPLSEPIPYKGALGLRAVPAELQARIEAAL